jgi:hypothetical protein
MKKKLAYLIGVPLLFSCLAFQGNCHSQCEELRQELIKDCREDLGPNAERCRVDQQRFQQACSEEFQGPPQE